MGYKRKPHQNPAWSINGTVYPELPNEPSRWDQFLAAERLDEKDALKKNPKVKDFVAKHHRSFFVPTKVLKVYGMDWTDA